MAKADDNFKLVVWTIVGLVLFWVVAIPAVALSKPFGSDNGNGVAIPK